MSFIWVEYSLTSGVNYILCTSHCPPITRTFNESTLLEDVCHGEDQNNLASSLACVVEYRIDYTNERIRIDFQGINETELFDAQQQNQYFEQTLSMVLSNDEHDGTELKRKFYCTMKEDCARSFYLNSIGQLIGNENPGKLKSIKNKLYNHSVLMNEHSRRRCIDNSGPRKNASVSCPMGPCFVSKTTVNTVENSLETTQKCHSERGSYLNSEIKYHISSSSSQKKELLEYRCNKNVCNREDMIRKVTQIIDEFTHWESSKQAMPIVHVKQAASVSFKSMVASSVLVFFSLSFHFLI